MMRPIPAHYIRENKAHNTPSRMVVVHAETVDSRNGEGTVRQWRCGVAIFIHWTRTGRMYRSEQAFIYPEDLWREVAAFTRPKQRTVLYCHNLPYAMRITQMLSILPGLGWHLDAIRVANAGAWSRWSRNKATLTLTDSASIFPVTIYTLGRRQGLPKMRLPEGDDIDDWIMYCVRNANIIADVMVDYMAWLRTGVAGNWQLTGAGQSWAHWRHAHYTHKVMVHADTEAIKAERRAMWTGRAENWMWGRDYNEPIYEWDWENAYPRIAHDEELPVRLAGTTGRISVAEADTLSQRYVLLADVEVSTSQPVVPARHLERILWPVGRFGTTLWWPEIADLLSAGGHVSILQVWLYQKAPALRQWASWTLGELHQVGMARPWWLGILLKHWSRALIGRFATQYQNWELFGLSPVSEVRTGTMYDVTTDTKTEFMQIGHEIHQMTGLTESDDSCPQITSYIMSVARSKLWSAMVTVGLSNVLYVDTDSLVLNTQGNARMRMLTSSGNFDGLRLKSRQLGYEIYGPRQAIIGDAIKFAGIPRESLRTGDTTWKGEVWTQFERALRIGEHDRVTIQPRRFNVRWNEHRRARKPDGTTTAYRLPEYRPAEPTGVCPPVTDREHEQKVRQAFNAKPVTTTRRH